MQHRFTEKTNLYEIVELALNTLLLACENFGSAFAEHVQLVAPAVFVNIENDNENIRVVSANLLPSLAQILAQSSLY